MVKMLKINKNQKREPRGGHHAQADGRTFRADSFENLVDKIADYRLNNGIPIGVPERDVLDYYRVNFPYMVTESPELDQSSQSANQQYDQWRSWVMSIWGSPPKKLITTKEAKDRWAKCQSCPFNRPLGWGETDESAQMSRRTFMLRRGIDVPQDIGFCSLHLADLSVFTFIDAAKQFSRASDGRKHDGCWVE